MNRYKYKVVYDNNTIAENMDIDIACSFAEFLFEKWHGEKNLEIKIVRVCNEPCQGVDGRNLLSK